MIRLPPCSLPPEVVHDVMYLRYTKPYSGLFDYHWNLCKGFPSTKKPLEELIGFFLYWHAVHHTGFLEAQFLLHWVQQRPLHYLNSRSLAPDGFVPVLFCCHIAALNHTNNLPKVCQRKAMKKLRRIIDNLEYPLRNKKPLWNTKKQTPFFTVSILAGE